MQTMGIRAIEVTGSSVGDAAILPAAQACAAVGVAISRCEGAQIQGRVQKAILMATRIGVSLTPRCRKNRCRVAADCGALNEVFLQSQ